MSYAERIKDMKNVTSKRPLARVQRPLPYEVRGGKNAGKFLVQLIFTEPGYVAWCWSRAEVPDLRDDIEHLLDTITTGFLDLPCDQCNGRLATVMEIPVGHDGHNVSSTRLICNVCDHHDGHRRYELSLRGLFSFCNQERLKCEQRALGRLLADICGIGRITKKAVVDLLYEKK